MTRPPREIRSPGGRAGTWMVATTAVVAALAGGAATAQAKTEAYVSGVNTVSAETGRGSSDRNDVKVGYDATANELIITDSLSGVKARNPCTKKSATTARCPAEQIYFMYVYTFQNNDKITLKSGGTNPFPSSGINTVLAGGLGKDIVKGGDSTDTVNGGQGDDIVTGGGGSDRLFGISGTDVLHADDGVADQVIDCGKDDDPDPFLDVGLDPAPQNC